MHRESPIKISQCMIVKNEEKNIERALSWGKGIVAEQIVVDTGSTDRTVELAENLAAQVYYFPWADDFSAAKNFAISKAQYSWIAFLDADEYFTEEDAKKLPFLLEEIQQQHYDGIATNWIHLNDDGSIKMIDTQVRIFRNRKGLRYHRRIHEYLAWEDSADISYVQDSLGLSIYHTGYGMAAEKKKRKGGRNLQIIQAELKEHPDDFEMLAYLGNEYVGLGEFTLAENTYREAISHMPERMLGVYHVAASEVPLRLLSVLVEQSNVDEDKLLNLYQWATAGWPEEGDYDYFLGLYYAQNKNFPKAELHIRKSLEIMEIHGNYQKSMVVSGKIISTYELLAACCFNNGDMESTVRLTTALLKENSYLMGALTLFVLAFRNNAEKIEDKKSLAMEIAALLGRTFYNFSSKKDRLFVLRAAVSAGYQELIEIIRSLFSEEELQEINLVTWLKNIS